MVTLGLHGDDPAYDFLLKLLTDDVNRFESLKTRIQTVSNHDHYENRITFRHVGQGVYEFKRNGIRLYAFYDEIDGIDHLILCTNGGSKNTRKGQQRDINLAKQRKADYLAIKTSPGVTINYQKAE